MAGAMVYLFTLLLCALTPLSVTADSLQDALFSGNYEFIDLTHSFNNETANWPGVKKFQFTKKTERRELDASCALIGLQYVPIQRSQKTADSKINGWTAKDLRPQHVTLAMIELIIYVISVLQANQNETDNPKRTDMYAAYEFATGEHVGTHLDAPYHFYQPGNVVGDLSLDKLIVPLVVIDVSSKVNGNPNYVLHKEDLGDVLQDLNKVCLVLFRFGWSQYFNDYQKYLGVNGTQLNFPGLSSEVAELITTTYKNVVGVGVDVASVDPGASTNFAVHKTLAKAGLYNLENVNMTRSICAKNCTALVMPMKIEQGTGAPVRLVAICPKRT